MTISMQLNEQFCLILSLKFTGKPWKSKKSFLSGHKWEGVNTKVTQNFRSLVINKLAAQYLYNIHTLTILFSTILGRVCDVLSKTGGTSENWQNGRDQWVRYWQTSENWQNWHDHAYVPVRIDKTGRSSEYWQTDQCSELSHPPFVVPSKSWEISSPNY